ncbi:MAG: hypothetical protein R6W90_15020 [Ignavibacteriaceae bacterium]
MNTFGRVAVFVLLILSVIINNNTRAQSLALGASVGGGYISGDSPDIGSFTSSLFLDVDLGFSSHFYNRLSFIYNGDFDNILPGTRNSYFPFIKGISLKGIITQDYENNYFLEEGVGFVYLNDRTFSFTNSWNFGVVFSLAAGIDFTDLYKKGFKLALGTEYAFAFGGTFPKYFSIHLQTKYTL